MRAPMEMTYRVTVTVEAEVTAPSGDEAVDTLLQTLGLDPESTDFEVTADWEHTDIPPADCDRAYDIWKDERYDK